MSATSLAAGLERLAELAREAAEAKAAHDADHPDDGAEPLCSTCSVWLSIQDRFEEAADPLTVAALIEVAQAGERVTVANDALRAGPRGTDEYVDMLNALEAAKHTLRAALAGLAGRLGGVQAGTEGER